MTTAVLTTTGSQPISDAAPVSSTVAPARQRSVKKTLTLSIVLTTVLIGIGVTIGMLAYTGEMAAAVGVGVLVGMWAGPGFGAMAGAAALSWQEEHDGH